MQIEGLGALPLNLEVQGPRDPLKDLEAEGSGAPQLDSGTLVTGSHPASPIHFNNDVGTSNPERRTPVPSSSEHMLDFAMEAIRTVITRYFLRGEGEASGCVSSERFTNALVRHQILVRLFLVFALYFCRWLILSCFLLFSQ